MGIFLTRDSVFTKHKFFLILSSFIRNLPLSNIGFYVMPVRNFRFLRVLFDVNLVPTEHAFTSRTTQKNYAP